MRYQVKQELFVVHFGHEGAGEIGRWYRQPMLWDNTQPVSITFNKLVVTEHHKVQGEYDEKGAEPKYDGYLLQDQEGNLFSNQYPRASYGQTSDEGNRRFSLRLTGREEYDEKIKTNPNIVFEYHLLTSILELIESALYKFGEIKPTACDADKAHALEKGAALAILRDRIYKQFKEEYPQYELIAKPPEDELFKDIGHVDVNVKKTLTMKEAFTASAKQLEDDLIQYKELNIICPNGDYLYVEQTKGTYLLDNEQREVKTLQVCYLEQSGTDMFDVNGTEYFCPEDTLLAVLALNKRLASTAPEKPSGYGGSLEEVWLDIRAAQVRKQPPTEAA